MHVVELAYRSNARSNVKFLKGSNLQRRIAGVYMPAINSLDLKKFSLESTVLSSMTSAYGPVFTTSGLR